jgi:alkaline phosphatase D
MHKRIVASLLALIASALAGQDEAPVITHGVASGDVTAISAILWARASVPARLETEYSLDANFTRPRKGPSREVSAETDFTGQITLTGLRPETRYYYRIQARNSAGTSSRETGSFLTAPRPNDRRNVRFLWAGDLGGQSYCRTAERGYEIFGAMTALSPDFVLFSGDMIYADSPCLSPPNLPGSAFVAKTLDEFRQRWKYNRDDSQHKKLLASTSMVTQWDDHEVTNDFAGPFEPLMPAGRQAYFEYHPMTRSSDESFRLYRSLRWGKEMELFVLDNRQYRAANTEPDSAEKSMLGRQQFQWLVRSLAQSDAVWKIIATSVPLTIATGTNWQTKGRDGWANGSTAAGSPGDRTGWEYELLELIKTIRDRKIANVIWVTTDVHFAQIASLDPFDDGKPFSYELISGPLSAVSSKPGALDTTLHPERLYAEGQFYNFGQVSIDARTHRLTAEIVGQTSVRYTLRLDPVF